MKIITGTAVLVLTLAAPYAGHAQVYSNNFESANSESNGLTASANMNPLSRFSRPTDGGGLSSANQSMWLGALGYGVAKNSGTPETVTLSLNGLVAGSTYNVAFDLLVGGSWDGSAGGGYGPDRWSATAVGSSTSTALVDATFSNCGVVNELCGATSPQSYSDATPLAGLSPTTFAPETGADYFWDYSYDYSQDYGIYYFGHGAGNPMLSFVADGSTASLQFQRASNAGDSADEYWGLDNIVVSGDAAVVATPEPASLVLLGTGLAGIAGWSRRRRLDP